jgi:hypothetical protein
MLSSEGDFQPLNKAARTYLHLVPRRDGLSGADCFVSDALLPSIYSLWPYFLGGNPSSSGNLHAMALVQGYELGTGTHDFIIPSPFTRD